MISSLINTSVISAAAAAACVVAVVVVVAAGVVSVSVVGALNGEGHSNGIENKEDTCEGVAADGIKGLNVKFINGFGGGADGSVGGATAGGGGGAGVNLYTPVSSTYVYGVFVL